MSSTRAGNRVDAVDMPAWPVMAGLVGFPIWWLLGVVDVIWVALALVMAGYLGRARKVMVPPGSGWWVLFLVLVVCSAIAIDRPSSFLVWGYRFSLYAAAGVIALYAYNARARLTAPVLVGGLVALWITTVAGGFLGMLMPDAVLRTPMAYVTPGGLLGNDLVNHMVIRRFSQYSPGSWADLAPRPSAPFHYTNNWGQIFSILTPFVIIAIGLTRRRGRSWLLMLLLPISLVPAFLTLNRGMFIGLGLAATYIAIRQAVRRNARALLAIAALVVVATSIYTVLPTEELLSQRLEGSSTTENRASLYQQSLDAAVEAPVFGHGVPQEADHPGLPPVGTQGQAWMVLVSHGPLALLCFLAWILMAWLRSLRRTELVAMVANAGLLVTLVQVFFYGLLPHGLVVVALLVALALRTEISRQHAGSPANVLSTTTQPESSADSVRMLSVGGRPALSDTTRPD